jgi:UPF0716 protein FxsA
MLWFVLLVLWPLAELFVIVKISEWIGFIWMLVLLFITWPVGTRLLRSQGRAALRRLSDAVTEGRTPALEVIDGAMALFGAVLLLVPGFITDGIGVLLLIPVVRRPLRRIVANRLGTGPVWRVVQFGTRGSGSARRRSAGNDYDVDSTAFDIDEPQLHS